MQGILDVEFARFGQFGTRGKPQREVSAGRVADRDDAVRSRLFFEAI
jgi:hypothetical protein